MNRKLLSLAVALWLVLSCSLPAYATAGSADDPLVSESYVDTWASGLLTELIAKAKARLEEAASHVTPESYSPIHALPANSLVTLDSGAVITLLSGTAKVTISKGAFVNATVGGAAINGRVIPGHTYIVCEDSRALVTVTADAVMTLEGTHTISPAQGTVATPTPIPSPTATPVPTPTAAPTPTPTVTPTAVPTPTPVVIVIEPTPVIIYVTVTPAPTVSPAVSPMVTPAATQAPATTSVPTSPTAGGNISFKDVSSSAWFYEDLKLVVKEGLMEGTSRTEFSPGEDLTVADAITLAAKLHARFSEDEETLKKGFWLWWYKPYRSYALEYKLIDEAYGDYSRREMNSPITKGELMEMLYRALPAEMLSPINTVDDNAIPDVKDFSTNAEAVYALYRAGILTGYLNAEGVADHSFKAHETLTRGETAVFTARILDPDRRVEFSLTLA